MAEVAQQPAKKKKGAKTA